MIVCNFARIVPDHNSPLELIDAHGEVTALDGDGGAAIDGATQRLDQVNAGLGADVALAHGAVLGVLAPGAAPDTAEVSRPGHAEAAVRVTWIQGVRSGQYLHEISTFIASHERALVEGDISSIHDIIAVPNNRN